MAKVRLLGIDDWVQLSDPKNGRPYYYSKSLRKTQWEVPVASSAQQVSAPAPTSAAQPVANTAQTAAVGIGQSGQPGVQQAATPAQQPQQQTQAAPQSVSVAQQPLLRQSAPEPAAQSQPGNAGNIKATFAKFMTNEMKQLRARSGDPNKKIQFFDLPANDAQPICLAAVKAVVFNPLDRSLSNGHQVTVKWECWTSWTWIISGGYKVRATEHEVDAQGKYLCYRVHEAYINSFGVLENYQTPTPLSTQGDIEAPAEVSRAVSTSDVNVSLPASSSSSSAPSTSVPSASASSAAPASAVPTATPTINTAASNSVPPNVVPLVHTPVQAAPAKEPEAGGWCSVM